MPSLTIGQLKLTSSQALRLSQRAYRLSFSRTLLAFLLVLLDYVFVEVVILINKVIAWKGGPQEIVPNDEEVEPQLEAIAIAVLQVDMALIVLAHVIPLNASA